MTIEHLHAVPHLTMAPTGPLLQIEEHLLTHQASIESWFRSEWHTTPAPFYASVDLRNAGFKLAPVDTNLFPAGFNNLNPAFYPLCIQAIQTGIERLCPEASKVLLLPEAHSRNMYYMENVATLRNLLERAGFEVRIASLAEGRADAETVELPSGQQLKLEPLLREGDQVGVGDFFPCLVLLNNDLASGRPAILEGVRQSVVPPLNLGWSNRLKSSHFTQYRNVAGEFASLVDIDPWLIDPLFRNCGEINYMKREGEDCLAKNVDALLVAIQRKYDEYDIKQAPFVMVKSDAGTYGMGIMMVKSADEVRELNRKQRTRMASAKGGREVTKVIMQEGVYTFETWGDEQAVAEPVVYMIDHFVVGGFYRVHKERGKDENLNAPGMHFEPLAFAEPCNNPDREMAPDANPNRFYAYGVIARLAQLAAAREIAA